MGIPMEISKDEWNELVKNVQKLNSMQPLILHEMERFSTQHKDIQLKVNKICIDVAKLNVKAGVWGVIGGAIPVIIFLVLKSYG
jgi:hypothetical protein